MKPVRNALALALLFNIFFPFLSLPLYLWLASHGERRLMPQRHGAKEIANHCLWGYVGGDKELIVLFRHIWLVRSS